MLNKPQQRHKPQQRQRRLPRHGHGHGHGDGTSHDHVHLPALHCYWHCTLSLPLTVTSDTTAGENNRRVIANSNESRSSIYLSIYLGFLAAQDAAAWARCGGSTYRAACRFAFDFVQAVPVTLILFQCVYTVHHTHGHANCSLQ